VRYLPLLWAGLFRKKTRTILTLLSIVVAFALFGLLQAVEVAFESGADAADAKRLLTTARYSIIEPLPMAYHRRIEQVPGVVGVAYADWFGAKYQNESNAFPVFAVDPTRYLDMYPEFTIAREQRDAFAKTRTGAVVGKRLADRFGWHVGQKLPISSEIHPKTDGSLNWEFDLVGIIDADDPAVRGNTDMVLINVAYFDEARQNGKGKTGWYIVRIAHPADSASVSEAIDTLFANSRAETQTETERAFQQSFLSAASAIITAMNIMSFVIIGIILLVLGNTMIMSVRERTHEYAVLKALGFSGPSLFFLIAGESMILAVLGSAFGLLVTLPAVEGFQKSLPKGWFPVFYIKPETILLACIAGLLVGFIASIIPIRRILTTRIVEGLRHVG